MNQRQEYPYSRQMAIRAKAGRWALARWVAGVDRWVGRQADRWEGREVGRQAGRWVDRQGGRQVGRQARSPR